MEKGLNIDVRNYDDFRTGLINLTDRYYPDLGESFADASVGGWMVDLGASIGDNLTYAIDRALSETTIDGAQQRSSLLSQARSNGLKIRGAAASMTEVEFSCELPVFTEPGNPASTFGQPDWRFAPVIKKGTKLSSGKIIFEVMDDVVFSEQFNYDGFSDRKILPMRDSNGLIVKYKITKLAVVSAGESRIYKKVLRQSDIAPFMEIILPDRNVLEVTSVITKDGVDFQSDPYISEFQYIAEFTPAEKTVTKVNVNRFFEVDALIQQYRWGDVSVDGVKPVTYKYGYNTDNGVVQTASVTKGEWKPLRQKFLTEFTDKGYLKIIFGSGSEQGRNMNLAGASDFAKYQITRMISNDALGVLPEAGSTLYVLYRVGGGQSSNIAAGTLNKIVYLNAEFGCITNPAVDQPIINAIRKSLNVTNIIPSVSGKNAPSENEIRWMTKYNNHAQDRCVTVKDYVDRVMKMPSRYGSPFRVGGTEENNKIMLYLLGIDYQAHLTDILPETLVRNIENYLSEFRMINDFVEIKSGRIINISFEVDVYVSSTYNKNDVVNTIISTIKNYMDINRFMLDQEVYVGDLMKEISKLDGVINLIDIRVYNEIDSSQYSTTPTSQPLKSNSVCDFNQEFGGEGDSTTTLENRLEIDLKASDYILYADHDSMFEVKFPQKDIRVRVKSR